MAKRKRRPSEAKNRPNRPKQLQIDNSLPTYDYLADKNLADIDDVQQLLEDLILDLEMDYFLRWEAVMRQEQGFRLNDKQTEILAELRGDEAESTQPILMINEMPRPRQFWYEIVQPIVPQLAVTQLDPTDPYFELYTQGWARLATALQTHTVHLTHPPQARAWQGLFTAALQHRLWVQYCFTQFVGVGAGVTLTDESSQTRIDWFIKCIDTHRQSINHFGLTLETLLHHINLPETEQAALINKVVNTMNLESPQTAL